MSESLQRAARLFFLDDADPGSPLVHRIWRTRSVPADAFISVARAHWTLVVTCMRGETSVTLRGPETHASHVAIPQDAEFFGIHFSLGTFMPARPMGPLVDNAETLPQLSPRTFLFDGSRWEVPRFDNADVFVERLVRKGLLKHDPILDILRDGRPRMSARSAQRRMLRSTGLTYGELRQIERAHEAVALLDRGVPILDVVERTGFSDQPHLTRSLKRFADQTPGEILREKVAFIQDV